MVMLASFSGSHPAFHCLQYKKEQGEPGTIPHMNVISLEHDIIRKWGKLSE